MTPVRQKRIGPRRWRRAEPEPAPIDVDVGASVRQVGLIESGTGMPHGPVAIVLAVGAAVILTGGRALWRAFTRVPSGRP